MNRIEELTALLERISPGEWEWRDDINSGEWCLSPGVLITSYTDGTPGGDEIDQANARFIAAAPQAMRDLLEVAKAAQALQRSVTFPQQEHWQGELRKALEAFK